MTLTFLKSIICPRCHIARRALKNIQKTHPELSIEEIDVTLHPLLAWQQGIKMIPAIKVNDQILAGVFLNEKKIQQFLKANGFPS